MCEWCDSDGRAVCAWCARGVGVVWEWCGSGGSGVGVGVVEVADVGIHSVATTNHTHSA